MLVSIKIIKLFTMFIFNCLICYKCELIIPASCKGLCFKTDKYAQFL